MNQLHAFIDASKNFAHADRLEKIWRDGNALRGASREEFELCVDLFLRWVKERNRRTEWLFHDIARFVDSGGEGELALVGEDSQSRVAQRGSSKSTSLCLDTPPHGENAVLRRSLEF